MSTATLPALQSNGHYQIDHNAVLKAVGINVRDANAQALLLTCERYGLDPILKHMVLIQNRPYVTRDGLLHVAHRSGQFDGIEVLEQGETQTHFTAKVAVYRKDMGRAFTYIGRYPKVGGNKAYGPEMAVKCGEVMALRRAFNVALCAREEAWDQDSVETTATATVDVAEVEPRDDGRQAVNETFPQREQWAGFLARVVREANDEFANEQAIEGVPQADRIKLTNQERVVHHLCTHAINSGAIEAASVDKDGKPGVRDLSKAKIAIQSLYVRIPGKIRAAVASYLTEKRQEARVKLGMLDRESEDSPGVDEPAGPPPGKGDAYEADLAEGREAE